MLVASQKFLVADRYSPTNLSLELTSTAGTFGWR